MFPHANINLKTKTANHAEARLLNTDKIFFFLKQAGQDTTLCLKLTSHFIKQVSKGTLFAKLGPDFQNEDSKSR